MFEPFGKVIDAVLLKGPSGDSKGELSVVVFFSYT